MAEEKKEIILLKSVGYGGKIYPPGSTQDWPASISDDLIDRDAAEPVLTVSPASGNSGGNASGTGTDPKRMELMIFAVQDAVDAGDINKDGSPNVGAMEDILGFDITSEERDLAWATYKKEQGIS